MRLGAHVMLFVLEMAIKFSGLPTCLENVTFIGRDDCRLARVCPPGGLCIPFLFAMESVHSCFKISKNKVTTSLKKKLYFQKH